MVREPSGLGYYQPVIIEFGRVCGSSRVRGARLRGATAGSMSGALALAAHGVASGGALPSSTTVTLLTAASAMVGAVATGFAPVRGGAVALVAALLGGQLLGHVTMGWTTGHAHHADDSLGLGMLSAHLIAALLAVVVIAGAEAAYRIATAVVGRVLLLRLTTPGPGVLLSQRPVHRDRVVLWIMAACSRFTRGPPMALRS
ncbi:hypothetical protein ATK86_4084 [Nocardia fluminea]|uniref:Uncharacterized protein n=1 Tax=Nocardia fluminea TaxID=134984 RepID=A0A2N3VDL5_9NOCA|nr:hypothetical protein ATK86_4084 [Nocardia fluminea]